MKENKLVKRKRVAGHAIEVTMVSYTLDEKKRATFTTVKTHYCGGLTKKGAMRRFKAFQDYDVVPK